MIKKQWVAALVLLLLIPVVVMVGGMLFSLINPEIAAGHPNYVRNYHLLNLLRLSLFWASFACAAALWILACLLVIRSKKRSYLWLILAALGPIGFAVLAMLGDREPVETDRYTRFMRSMNGPMRIAYELGCFVVIWVLAYQAMVLKRNLMVAYEAATTGVSTAQIISVQNASSGMWAFGEGIEVMFLVVLFYALRPFVIRVVASVAARGSSPKPH